MNRAKECMEENKFPIIIAVVQWFLTTLFQVDRHFFIYESETKYLLIVKILYFVFLLVSWCFIVHVCKKCKENNNTYIRGVRFFSIYLFAMMLILLVLWPGTWSWDDIGILLGIRQYSSFVGWQHVISGCYQAVLLQILPFPGGIILIQNVIISVCVAYTAVKLESCFRTKKFSNPLFDIGIKLLPFFLPPVLLYQFSGFRMGLYVYLELVMLVMILCGKYEEKEWSWKGIALFGLLIVVVSSWRTESFFYVVMMPLLMIFWGRKNISVKKSLFCIISVFIIFAGLNKIQNIALGNSNYKLISLMGPYAAVVRAADYGEDKEYIDVIDKVVDVDAIHKNPRLKGDDLYWNGHAYRNGYTPEDFNDSIIALVRLSLKYPRAVVAERWNLFIRSMGITGATWRINSSSIKLFEEDEASDFDEVFKENGWLPVLRQGRKALINILSCNRLNGELIGPLRKTVWNAAIPILILIYAWLRFLMNREWFLLGVCTSVIIRIPVVFLTEPAGWLMYLLSFYFLGYVFLVYGILIDAGKKEAGNNG